MDGFDKDLLDSAETVIGKVAARLPADIREATKGVAVGLELEMADRWLDEGIDPDNLGLFSGPSLRDPECDSGFEPPRITLFLYNLWDYAEGDWDKYDAEVRRTYLHELGHYLGLEEGDMPRLGLD